MIQNADHGTCEVSVPDAVDAREHTILMRFVLPPCSVLVGSYNVNGWKCNRELKDWLYMNEIPDVIAVG